MTNTTYYNLNIAEGTDIVNPLTVDNPNYEKIDVVMHDNAVAGVTLATELTSATVHALTRENSDCSVIRFIATSRWKAGDSVTVDGVPVLALLPSGETLPDGAYVINANVLCVLTGTNLTVYAEGKKAVNANEIPYNDTNVGAELAKLNNDITEVTSNLSEVTSNVTSNLNVRYNKDTDMVQIYYNGAWKDWEIAGLQKYIMVENGAPKVTFENPNSGTTGTAQQIDGEWVVTSNNGGFRQLAAVNLTNRTTVTANMRATIGSGGGVDLIVSTLDNPLTSVISAQIANAASPSKYNLDVSNLSGEYYVGVNVYGESGVNTAAEITSLIVS